MCIEQKNNLGDECPWGRQQHIQVKELKRLNSHSSIKVVRGWGKMKKSQKWGMQNQQKWNNEERKISPEKNYFNHYIEIFATFCIFYKYAV